MNGRKAKILLLTVIAIMAAAFALFGCEKKEEFLKISDVKGLEEVRDKGTLIFEWLDGYDEEKPTLFVFHGETDENEVFTINLDAQVYGEEVTYLSEDTNAEKIGLKGNGLKLTDDGKFYDMQSYWTDTAKFNVAVFHAEKFLCEGADASIAKIYTTYKSRYVDGGETVECNFGYSLSEIVAAIYYNECIEKNIGKREIRFLGYGVGANIALACAHYLNLASGKTIENAYLPSRLTLCDPFITEKSAEFDEINYGGITAEKGTAFIAATMIEDISVSPVAVEIVSSEEVDGEKRTYAYENQTVSGETYEKITENAATLILSESYSTKSSYTAYKNKKRVAFDWYVYSVIGSDDSASWKAESQKYPIGYPHAYGDLPNTSTRSVNWGTGGRRPILNDRKRTNDVRADAGATAGKNFGISAWTPTEYVNAIEGLIFTQREAKGSSENTDEHGNYVYEYVDYVLPTFKSENYQYSAFGGETRISGKFYLDENGDGYINDGDNRLAVTFFVTVQDNKGNVLVERAETKTDKNGEYLIVIERYGQGGIKFTAADNGGKIAGFAAKSGELVVIIEIYTPKGYNAQATASGKTWYEAVNMNNFEKGQLTVTLDKTNVKSAIVGNCLLTASEK